MLIVFVILAIPVAAFLLFRAIMRSRMFNRLCATFFGPDDASDVIDSLDTFEQIASQRAAEEEAISESKRLTSENLRKRVRRDTVPSPSLARKA